MTNTVTITVNAPVAFIIVTGNPLVGVGSTQSMTATAIPYERHDRQRDRQRHVVDLQLGHGDRQLPRARHRCGPRADDGHGHDRIGQGVWPVAVVPRTLKSVHITAAPRQPGPGYQRVGVDHRDLVGRHDGAGDAADAVAVQQLVGGQTRSAAVQRDRPISARADGTAQITAVCGFLTATATVTVSG